MIDAVAAEPIAQRSAPQGLEVDLQSVVELREGWFFPFKPKPIQDCPIGCNGIIVNKHTGRVLRLGSAFPRQRDLEMYDKGYQFNRADLVILSVADAERVLGFLAKLRVPIVEPEYSSGTVWRVPRDMTKQELRARLQRLPAIFEVYIYFKCELIEEARKGGYVTFDLLERRSERLPEE